ncbi:hypothetical protein [Klebsiella aerogenes]|jgi:hypothetical protein|uniref:hypothetical protein n=1 Tax=Klebsiella aerogenes TaxID=548 RepID=UPI00063C090F|nr:hypothetical protein [Klebsiella aerogenes]DAT30155.1 MAG TPA: hypothetical protein [Caudoviricetes sp.]AMQ58156.1 hypothetical protein AL497_24355 [Klebsiella aerogenes]AVF02252.1 hypothetical protein AM441_27120 [Klebsiella aerogenes]EKU4983887.1 hypothetical protein [Klebsiella aerogenes]EME1359525.1 hypothetical protein [Klebsiella aerogenes]
MTDITRLINSIKRRSSSARELGYDILFVTLDDLDVLADSLETALRANTAQADHIEQLQDIKRQLESKLARPVQLPKTNGYWTEEEKVYEEAITFAKRQIRLAGFRCEGDE